MTPEGMPTAELVDSIMPRIKAMPAGRRVSAFLLQEPLNVGYNAANAVCEALYAAGHLTPDLERGTGYLKV